MDNNFNMEMPVVEQPQPKKKTGLIIGLVAGGVAVVAAIVVALILILGGGEDFIGKWSVTEEGATMTLEFKDDNTGKFSVGLGSLGSVDMDMKWSYNEDTKVIKATVTAEGETEEMEFKVVECKGDSLKLSSEGDELTFKKVD